MKNELNVRPLTEKWAAAWVAGVLAAAVACERVEAGSESMSSSAPEASCDISTDFRPSGSARALFELELGTDESEHPWPVQARHLSRMLCQEPGAIEALEKELEERPSIWATLLLTTAERRDMADVIAVVPKSSLPDFQHLYALQLIADLLPKLEKEQYPSLERVTQAVEWASSSETVELRHMAAVIRISAGEPSTFPARALELMECVDAGASGCLLSEEHRSAPNEVIAAHWDAASADQRIALARWAAKTPDNQRFLASKVVASEPSVQAVLMDGILVYGPNAHLVELGKAMLRQALADPARRPPAYPFHDVESGGESFPGEDLRRALRVAFEEVRWIHDEQTQALYDAFDQLDHPWLSTMAGIGRVRHGDIDAFQAFRFAMDDDGFPLYSVLAPAGEGALRQTALLVRMINQGGPERWRWVAQLDDLDTVLHGDLLEAAVARVSQLPERMDRISPGLDPDTASAADMNSNPLLEMEVMSSLGMIDKLGKKDRDLMRRLADAWYVDTSPMSPLLAMLMLAHIGDDRVEPLIEHFSVQPGELAQEMTGTARKELVLARERNEEGASQDPH
jgi:hypothetical protein